MSVPAPNAQRSPRRKAGRKADRKAERAMTFRLVVEAQEMVVTYDPIGLDGEFALGHFEFRSPYEPPRRIPVSKTGYLSHFAPFSKVAGFDSPEDYAKALVLAVLGRGAKQTPQRSECDQLTLF